MRRATHLSSWTGVSLGLIRYEIDTGRPSGVGIPAKPNAEYGMNSIPGDPEHGARRRKDAATAERWGGAVPHTLLLTGWLRIL
jgi:hypothetical protein